MSLLRCPKCGKVISLRFPLHDCTAPKKGPTEKERFIMWLKDNHEWVIECESPLEITCEQYSNARATGHAAQLILDHFKRKWRAEQRGSTNVKLDQLRKRNIV